MSYIISYIFLMIFMALFGALSGEWNFPILIMIASGFLYVLGILHDIEKDIKKKVV